jgi:hypothetical protein
MLRGQTFFSCQTCYDAEERKLPPRRYDLSGYYDVREPPLPGLGEKSLPELLDEPTACSNSV